jgi:hypothetical protein
MKTSRLVLFFALLVALPSLLSAAAANAGAGRVRVILIVASNEKGAVDPKLADYDANLRRILRFESFRWVAEGVAAVPGSGSATVSLAREHRIELAADGRAVRATWFEGARRVIALALPEGRPSVLGGPPWGDRGEVSAIILVPESGGPGGK